MSLIVYADQLFISSMILSFITLSLFTILIKENYRLFRLLILSFSEAVITTFSTIIFLKVQVEISRLYYFVIILYFVIMIIKMVCDSILISGYKGFKNLLANLFLLLLLSMTEVGLLLTIYFLANFKSNITLTLLIFSGALAAYVSTVITAQGMNRINKLRNTAKILLIIHGKNLELQSLVDSGNLLKNPSDNKSVVIVSDRFEINEPKLYNTIEIKCHTITGTTTLKGCYADYLSIVYCGKKYIYEEVPVVFSNEFLFENYVQAIISSELIK